jgi:hypothetical protein
MPNLKYRNDALQLEALLLGVSKGCSERIAKLNLFVVTRYQSVQQLTQCVSPQGEGLDGMHFVPC